VKLTCTNRDCDRTRVRQRPHPDGSGPAWWCQYHPDEPAPAMDMISGKLRGPDGKAKPDVRPQPAYRAPGRVIEPPIVNEPDDVQEDEDEDDQPEPPTAPVTTPSPAAPIAPRRPAPARRPPPALDEAAVAQRYQDGEKLETLATSLHIGKHRLRRILAAHNVPIRPRGGDRRPKSTLDEGRVRELYAAGVTTAAIARMLHVQVTRVTDVLRAHDELRPAGQRHPATAAAEPAAPTTPPPAPEAPPVTEPEPTPDPAPEPLADEDAAVLTRLGLPWTVGPQMSHCTVHDRTGQTIGLMSSPQLAAVIVALLNEVAP